MLRNNSITICNLHIDWAMCKSPISVNTRNPNLAYWVSLGQEVARNSAENRNSKNIIYDYCAMSILFGFYNMV